MERYKGVICATYEELTQAPEGVEAVMTVPNYKQLVLRGRLNVLRTARGLGSYALVEFSTMPGRFKERFIELHGDPEQLIREQEALESVKLDAQAQRFYEEWKTPKGEYLQEPFQREYTINASVLNELIDILKKRTQARKKLGACTGSLMDSIEQTVEDLRARTGHTLPKSGARLQQKINDYKREGYSALVSGKFGNSNTVKITEQGGKLIIALRRSRVPIHNIEGIFKEYNRRAPGHGWKPLKSEQAVQKFLSRPDIEPLWYDAVYGETAAKQRYGRKHKTNLPTMRDSLWYGDGTKLNLYYKHFVRGKGWEMRTTQVYEVIDAYSEVLLGFHISDTENYTAQYRAFRMAVETAGQRPYEIVTDNQGGHRTKGTGGFIERLVSHIGRPTAPYNPQSKSIESVFGRFQAQVLHKDWRFTGQNITAKSDASRPNLEFVIDNKENLYTLEELQTVYAAMREQWNAMPHPATGRPRIEMYRESVNSECVAVGANDMVDMFWERTERSSLFTSSGITIEINNQKYTYEPLDADGMPDMEFRRQHTFRSFFVKYDPLDMRHVKLFEQTASGLRFVADAVPYIEVQRNIQEQRPGDMAFIRQQDAINKHERVARQTAAAELEMQFGVAPEQHGLNRPKLRGISVKATEELMGKEVKAKPRRAGKEKFAPVDIGLIEKAVSNQTFDKTSRYSKI